MTFAHDLLSGLHGVRDRLHAEGSPLLAAADDAIGVLAPVVEGGNVFEAQDTAVEVVKGLLAAKAGAPAAAAPAAAKSPAKAPAAAPA